MLILRMAGYYLAIQGMPTLRWYGFDDRVNNGMT
jgi:hypothetical protein